MSNRLFRRWSACILLVLYLAACGTSSSTDFAHSLVDAEGQTILLEVVAEIVNDGSLTLEAQREQLRALGIEDEKLIDALLTGASP